jgi:hypothetical protein
MPSTYTLNNGIELIGTGEQSGTWGDTTNTNLGLLDAALDGQVTITLAAAGSSGSPNALPITDGTTSNGRNRMVVFADGADLGATAYVQLTPNDAEKIIYIRNSLSGSRSVILFQGTYNASNDYEVPAGTTAIVYFDGAGAGAVAANVFNNAYFDGLRLGSVSVTAILDEDNMASDSATALATQQSIKAYVDAQVDTVDTLAEILAIGNTTGATDIAVDSAQKVQFRDAAIYINSSVDGQLDIVADTEIQIGTTLVDLNGNLNVSGTTIVTGVLTTTAATVFNGGITMPDSGVAKFGTGSDLQIYHDAANSYIEDSGTGSLFIRGTSLILEDAGGNDYIAMTDTGTGGTVELKHNAVTKLATTATGIDVTGTVVAASGTALLPSITTTGDLNTGMWFPAADTIAFSEGGVEALRIDSSGNVGIGTSSPTGFLNVSGTAGSAFPATSGSTQSAGLITRLQQGGAIGSVMDIGGNGGNGSWIQVTEASNLATNYSLLLNPNGGSVGIGTTSPSSKLHVVSSSGENKIISEATAASQQASMSLIVQAATPGQTVIYMGKTGATTNGQLGYDPNTDAMTMFTNNAERMRINSSGNVGIGTTSPTGILNVKGTGGDAMPATSGSTQSAGLIARLQQGGGIGSVMDIGGNGGGGSWIQVTEPGDLATNYKLLLNPNGGNVGIGTPTPSSKLEIQVASGDLEVKLAGATATHGIRNQADGSWGDYDYTNSRWMTLRDYSTDYYMIFTGGTERLRIDSSGNLCLGTTASLGARFVLHGTSGGTNNNIQITNPGYGTGCLGVEGTSSNFKIYNSYAAGTLASGAGIDINTSGNVGIGTSSPATTLQVNGDVTIYGTPSTSVHGVQFRNLFNVGAHLFSQGAATTNTYINWINANGTVGSIAATGSGVAYNTSSDYRLKEDWQLISAASDRVLALKPINFAWIVDGSRVDGFLAHELAEVVPEAVTGTKDAMMDEEYEVTAAVLDDDGNVVTEAVMGTRSVPYYQGIDQSKLVPLLTAALQEALTKIADMEIRLSALEG